MTIEEQRQKSNNSLIEQVAGYYNSTLRDIEDYQDMRYTVLEDMAKEHLMHWKKELRRLILEVA